MGVCLVPQQQHSFCCWDPPRLLAFRSVTFDLFCGSTIVGSCSDVHALWEKHSFLPLDAVVCVYECVRVSISIYAYVCTYVYI